MEVRAWQELVVIPTYNTGEPDKNPMFLEKRVYQGSSGAVYPHAVIDKICDEKVDKTYNAVFLENEYLKIMILPELGGRIQMALDKTNGYHFVYYNQVIKPALVGLTGPWISGGIEFNWPQHHRPSTFAPVDFCINENADGSKTVWVNEIEQMSHTKGMAGFTLYPDKAYLEIKGKLYNRTPIPQTFLWWANPAVAVDEHYQSVFPPDVNAVYDHGKRDVSSFPIATGTYYKVDYSPGTDISRYNNIPVPTSYMAVNSAFDFVGGYNHAKKAGLLHVADHHVSPGKKQWTWGSGEFGKAWDKQLTDEDGPYFELMTGMFTDNQPDFSWIMPNEERNFCQYFMPYKNIGYVKNATIDAAVNLQVDKQKVSIDIYVTAALKDVEIRLYLKNELIFTATVSLSPAKTFSTMVDVQETFNETELRIEVLNSNEQELVSYVPVVRKEDAVPDPASAIAEPASIKSNEELFLAAKHLEQYRHATYSPVDYYQEALKRDPFDIRNNQGLGNWYFKKGKYTEAQTHFNTAIQRITKHNPNPYDVELYYQLGLTLFAQQRYDEAYNTFYKTYWSSTWQDNGALYLARIDSRRKKYTSALEHASNSLNKNYHGFHARHIKAALLRLLNRDEEALKLTHETLAIDPFQFGTINEQYLLLKKTGKTYEAGRCLQTLMERMRGAADNFIETALDYAHAGLYKEAIDLLLHISNSSENPYVYYYLSFFYSCIGKTKEATCFANKAADQPAGTLFSNRLEDIITLQFITQLSTNDYKAWYYLGNIWYDKKQYGDAMQAWQTSIQLFDGFATVHRNMGIAYYNRSNDASAAIAAYEKAFALDRTDARVLFELDYLYKRNNKKPADRLSFLKQHEELVNSRDDLFIEFVTLHNLLGLHKEAAELLAGRNFHPWEGGEGKASGQHITTYVELAKKAIADKKYKEAIQLLKAAEQYPENLGEGKLHGARENDIHFWMGCACDELNEKSYATVYFELAASGDSNPAPAIFYNDQSPDKIAYQAFALMRLNQHSEAEECLTNLIAYAKEHMDDEIKIDYFAVSLPDLMIFDDDLNKRNRIHCLYMEGLGYLGLQQVQKAKACFEKLLAFDASHQGALLHLQLLTSELFFSLLKKNIFAKVDNIHS
jgi:tetratricopeptide (TPR) repeat protein